MRGVPQRHITIVGASVRAAAMSAIRAGLSPIAGDLFADVDLRRCCPTTLVPDFPVGLAEVCAGNQSGGWMYTGALENHPSLIARMAAIRPLWGNDAATVRAIRDPVKLASSLRDARLPTPEVTLDPTGLPGDGSWLRKPQKSAGGYGIEPLIPNGHNTRLRDVYFQEYIAGQPCSAVFVSARRQAVMLGVTEQLLGASWTGAGGLRYCGSIGPLSLNDAQRSAWHQIGDCLAERFNLIGLWGVDAILAGDIVWPVEVNPRYTASVEVLERAVGISSIADHLDACIDRLLPRRIKNDSTHCVGKAIIYALGDLSVSGELADWIEATDRTQSGCKYPILADIPARGATVAPGWPIATVFVDGRDRTSCVSLLRKSAAELFTLAQAETATRSDRAPLGRERR